MQDKLQQYLETAELAVLLPTVAHLSGDFSLLRPQWRPSIAFLGCKCSMTPGQEKEARTLCTQKLEAFFAAGHEIPPAVTYDQLSTIGRWMAGDQFDPILPFIAEECVTEELDRRKPRWNKNNIAPERPFHVTIIGAGFSGLVVGFRLKQAGVPFTIYEKNADVGGTWWENTYPGSRCDLTSFTYSLAFKRHTWPEVFSAQPDILAYMQECARECGLYEHIRFNNEVSQATWNENRGGWELDVETETGSERVFSNVTVFGVGQLNRPRLPDVPGIDSFAGPSFHSARWDHALDLTGKRVAVIGTGASSVQFTPHVATQAEHLTLFGRSTAWFIPTPDLHDAVAEDEKWLLDNLPHYSMWKRAGLVTSIAIGVLDECVVDPDYPPPERAVSAKNEELRTQLAGWQEANIADCPELRDVVIPDSPVGAKRLVRDNGTWTNTLKRDNVTVVKDTIAEITPRGVKCADGTEHEVDVIIYGTGFRVSDFLFPVDVYGCGGMELAKFWDGNPNAYNGITVPKFPNLFCLYGPKTNLAVHGGTIIQFSELAAKYVLDAVRYILDADVNVLDLRTEVFEAYKTRVEDANALRSWGWSKAAGWYRNKKGHGMVYPFPAEEYWHRTDRIDPTDYNIR